MVEYVEYDNKIILMEEALKYAGLEYFG